MSFPSICYISSSSTLEPISSARQPLRTCREDKKFCNLVLARSECWWLTRNSAELEG